MQLHSRSAGQRPAPDLGRAPRRQGPVHEGSLRSRASFIRTSKISLPVARPTAGSNAPVSSVGAGVRRASHGFGHQARGWRSQHANRVPKARLLPSRAERDQFERRKYDRVVERVGGSVLNY
uniref:(northern house mosquito) hypothetical protein n=1 Tax=Culex pipiens TaxID=7175 RepID=A0A8D8DXS9_CULPI